MINDFVIRMRRNFFYKITLQIKFLHIYEEMKLLIASKILRKVHLSSKDINFLIIIYIKVNGKQ